MTRVQRRTGAAIGAVLLAGLALAGPPASAHSSVWSYGGCTLSDMLESRDVRVGYTELPADGAGDGVVNSFRDRARDATIRMDTALSARSTSGRGLSWVGLTSSSNPAEIAFFTDTSLIGGTLGSAYQRGACYTVHRNPKLQNAGSVYIGIAVRSDWFTQDDSRRSYWEGCASRGNIPAYTCSKSYDAGSTMIHEVGHMIGLVHPSTVDAHIGSGTTSMSAADCTVANDQATMCQAGNAVGSGYQRTHRRTLHSFDLTSIAVHY